MTWYTILVVSSTNMSKYNCSNSQHELIGLSQESIDDYSYFVIYKKKFNQTDYMQTVWIYDLCYSKKPLQFHRFTHLLLMFGTAERIDPSKNRVSPHHMLR